MKKSFYKIITIIFSFFISLFLFISIFLLVIDTTVLNSNYCIKNMRNTHYYSMVSDEIERQFKNFSDSTGFDESVFDDVVNVSELTYNINVSVDNIYNGESANVNTKNFERELKDRLYSYADQRDITVTDLISQAIEYLIKECSEIYVEYAFPNMLNYLSPYIVLAKKIFPIIIISFLALSLLLSVVIYHMTKFKHRAIRKYIYAISGTTLMVLMLPIVYFIWGKIYDIGIISLAMYDFIISYTNNIFKMFAWFSFVLILLILVLYIIYIRIREKLILKILNKI